MPTGAGSVGRAGRAGGVPGLESALSLSLLATLVAPGVLEMVDALVTGVDCCPRSVMLVPLVLGLLTCLESGWLVWGATIAPRRGRFCGKRSVLGRALVEKLGSGSGFMRLDRAGAMSEGDPVPVFFMTNGKGGRRVGAKGRMPGCRVAGAKGKKLIA